MLRGFISRLGWVGCALGLLVASVQSVRAEPDRVQRQGQVTVVTYNVAGLPEGLSNVHPVQNLPLIGELLSKFDVALVQEDFAYPALLRQRLRLPYKSAPFVRGQALHFGDGLSLFSKLPLGEVTRASWSACHGIYDSYSDCLTPKGLARSRLELAPGVLVDVYDAHFDAGGGAGDREAREKQQQQLVETMRAASPDRALLLGGDFNLTVEEVPAFKKRMAELGVVDACSELRCPQGWRVDRVLYRSGGAVLLKPKGWRLGAGFHDAGGHALSDHDPVVVTFGWQTK
jgi:endonuclease/exonuclease/phosphatase family metal-dependent hydrolase